MCPISREITSTGMPLSDSSDTKLWRNSRGVQCRASTPGALLIALRTLRRTFAGSSAVPYRVVNTKPVSCQRGPAAVRSWP